MEFVFAKEFLSERNRAVAFQTRLKRGAYRARIAAGNTFRIFLGTAFKGYGPMRTAHGYTNLYELDLNVSADDTPLTVEVCAYRVNSYAVINEPPFFGIELYDGSGTLVKTAEDFACFHVNDRIQRTGQYSMMRTFTEGYDCKADRARFYAGEPLFPRLETCPVKGNTPLACHLSYPAYERREPVGCVEEGGVRREEREDDFDEMFFYPADAGISNGFPRAELELDLLHEIHSFTFCEGKAEGSYREYRFERNTTGFLSAVFRAKKQSTAYLLFDELHPVIPWRMSAVNAVKLTLAPGEYHFVSAEPYTLQCCKVVIFGEAEAEGLSILTYENPDVRQFPPLEDGELNTIFQAAVHTFRHNAVDILTDCPSRERGGYLCDSYFTARAEYFLTGQNKVEYNLLRAYFLAPDPAPKIPKHMFPMCYPADHDDGRYIVNWGLWLILELKDFARRGGDGALIAAFREKVDAFLKEIARYENEYELLEDVGGWVFVEWSKANDFIKDVNYPSNMLYCGALRAAGELYGDEALVKKAERIAEVIRAQSFRGKYFADNAVREGGTLRVTDNTTETCQYYAFYFGIASKETHPALFRAMFEGDGSPSARFPELHPANAFIGNALRLDLLYREGRWEQLKRECKAYFLYMAQESGTLWEHREASSSCDHGFASVAALWLWDACRLGRK